MVRNDRLAIFSTRNPTQILYNTIANMRYYYPDFDIVVIDSDSDNSDMLYKICEDFQDIKIEFIKNKNYELGAWHYAFYKYNNYKVYMFLQDTLCPTCRIPDFDNLILIDNIVFSFHYMPYIAEGGYIENLRDIYRGSELSFISEFPDDHVITGGAHSSFIANKNICAKILELEDVYREKQLVKSKIDSWLSERTVGIMSDWLGCYRVDIMPFFHKFNGGRV